MNPNRLWFTPLLIIAGCAAIPPHSDYIACSGSEDYKVCERIKYCDNGTAVLVAEHFYQGQWTRSVDTPCSGDPTR